MTAFGMFLAAIWFGLIVFSLMINNNKRISLSNDKAGRCWGRATIKDVQEKKEPQDTHNENRHTKFLFVCFSSLWYHDSVWAPSPNKR